MATKILERIKHDKSVRQKWGARSRCGFKKVVLAKLKGKPKNAEKILE